jgi:hypothetical protein
MGEKSSAEITQTLREWNEGDEDAKERLIPFVLGAAGPRLFTKRKSGAGTDGAEKPCLLY